MARVFVSSLGLGRRGYGYDPIIYKINEKSFKKTSFVQRAIMEAYGSSYFDRTLILVTKSSREQNWAALEKEFVDEGVDLTRVRVEEISEDVNREDEHWAWFEKVLAFLDTGDELVLDLTHGFRIVPIVLSAAVGYLQAAKSVRLEAVLYGADMSSGQIIDCKSFYRVNAWADAVSRLVEKADADKLAELANSKEGREFSNLRDPELVDALRDLSKILTNIEVHAVATRARKAVELIHDRMAHATGAERQMLLLVADKFARLVSDVPSDGKYSKSYLALQVEISQMLLGHGLNMQAYTVMRELVGSIGMLGLKNTKYDKRQTSSEGYQYRGRFAETFISMINYDRDKWKFDDELKKKHRPYWCHGLMN